MVPSPFDPFFQANGFVVLDGGLATELEAQGADLSGDLWSAALLAENPSLIRDTHLAYYRAGADVAVSASYQASFEGFLKKGFGRDRAEELLLLSVKLAVEARDLFWAEHQSNLSATNTTKTLTTASTATTPEAEMQKAHDHRPLNESDMTKKRSRRRRLRPLVAASLGCYGAALADGSEYRGDYGDATGVSQERLKEFHAERLDVLARAKGIDLVFFETVPCLAEARAILSLLQASERAREAIPDTNFRPSISAVISVSCKDDQHLRSGESVRDFADLIWRRDGEGEEPQEVAPACVVGVGVNCTAPIHVAGVLRTLAQAAAKETPRRFRSPSSSGSSSGNGGRNTAKREAQRENALPSSSSSLPLPPLSSEQGSTHNSASTPPPAKCYYGAPGIPLPGPRIALVAYPNSGEEWDACARDWVEGTGLQEMEGGR
ncbi:unnamed protein product, partial [Scytosiphon promiscuus]